MERFPTKIERGSRMPYLAYFNGLQKFWIEKSRIGWDGLYRIYMNVQKGESSAYISL